MSAEAGKPGIRSGFGLEPSPEVAASLTSDVLDYVLAFHAARRDAPAASFDKVDDLLALVRHPAPEQGRPLAEVMSLIAAATTQGHDTTGDGWLAYVPGGGLYTSALGDFIARVTNRFVGVWEPAPVLAEIEATVVRWFCDQFGLPATARGVLTTGGSMATLAALVAARTSRLGESFQDGTVYITSETHSAIAKAAVIAGFPRSRIRLVPTTPRLQMDPSALAAMVRKDRAAGLRPFAVVASAGTTNTGAVDDIGALADLARLEDLWLHVDAAYGGFFQLTARGRSLFAGIERADSIVLDPHKGLFLPYGTGAVLVRDGRALRVAHEIHGPYLQDLAPESDIPNFSDYSAELSRDSRGLRVWLPIMLHGVDASARRSMKSWISPAPSMATCAGHRAWRFPGSRSSRPSGFDAPLRTDAAPTT